MSNVHINIPINQLTANNTLKKSISKLIICNSLDFTSKDFHLVLEYCKSDTRYVHTTFEYMMNELDKAKCISYFELFVFLFDKSKTMKQLMYPRIHKIFSKAFSISSVKERAIELLKQLDKKYGESYPSIRIELNTPTFCQTEKDIEQHNVFVEKTNESEYQIILKRIDNWKIQCNELKKQWYYTMEQILPQYYNKKQEYHGEPINCSWGVTIELCQTPYEVWCKYGGTTNQRIIIDMKTLKEKIISLRGSIWNGYISFVLVQSKLKEKSTDEQELYKEKYKEVVNMIDCLDEILYKARELKI
ncbi:hypothetical protein ENUP19_0298G0006 [Entamoeba nuttalli]|uniref:Uncharacterized protein n=2 Tax=Entamoeba nuttalli TaxID=412467 RepID=K2GID6_ENTNP|nr:hypothetical protein ENU1_018400 [Entamoeba nuttalli P19]EKE42521.1 hypothetical protein ENU1_018400 [Entamoeba nuttalli P19]|eukprot:XP_008855141.1 hypothetical protein ENU1_018400 [Entamoeba nuttalli P19]